MKKEGDRATEFQVDEQELQALSQQVAERRIEEKDWETIHRYLLLFLKLSQVFQYGRVRMRRIARMLFGKRTEKDRRRKIHRTIRPNRNPPLKKHHLLLRERNRIQGLVRTRGRRRQRKAMDAGLPATIKTHKRLSARFVRTRPETYVRLAGKGA